MTILSTHVLDAVSGGPAVGVPVTLTGADGSELATGHTDADGRIGDLGRACTASGIYRLSFDTAAYFKSADLVGFYPEIVIAFEVTDTSAKYHVPVLLSPFAYSTYRGS